MIRMVDFSAFITKLAQRSIIAVHTIDAFMGIIDIEAVGRMRAIKTKIAVFRIMDIVPIVTILKMVALWCGHMGMKFY